MFVFLFLPKGISFRILVSEDALMAKIYQGFFSACGFFFLFVCLFPLGIFFILLHSWMIFCWLHSFGSAGWQLFSFSPAKIFSYLLSSIFAGKESDVSLIRGQQTIACLPNMNYNCFIGTQLFLFIYKFCSCFYYNDRTEYLQQRPHSLQTLK